MEQLFLIVWIYMLYHNKTQKHHDFVAYKFNKASKESSKEQLLWDYKNICQWNVP